VINRGGEKIAPREIDEVLMEHPGVMQAVTFAVPHSRLGEDVAAAVVLRKGASVTEREAREFLLARLADFKVPSQIVIVDEIPKGPTGKLQRIGLADKLASILSKQYEAPRNQVEEALATIWAEILGLEKVGVHDNFFVLGGDSLLATRLMSRLRSIFEVDIPLKTIFGDPTIAGQALLVEEAVLQQIEQLSEEEAKRMNTENQLH
jgi:acyl carrier protein